MFDSSTAPQQPKMQWQLWRSPDIRHKMQKTQLELQMHIRPCVIIKVIKPWHLLANDLAQLVNIFKEHVVVGHGPTRPGNLHSPQKSVQMVNISEDCSVDTSEYQECAAKRHADSRRYRSPNSDKQEMIDSCRF